jgi:SAM-dependent methyltransferase
MTDTPTTAADRHARQVEAWNGRQGEQWAANEARTERGLAPVLDALLAWAAPQPGQRIVDVGCGAGGTTLALSEAVGATGHVTGMDVSAVILEAARARLAATANTTLELADALTWTSPAPADLLFSRFGVMFFGDPVAAFANLRHSLKPGGRFAFAAWAPLAENPWMDIPYQAALSVLPPPAPPLPPSDPNEPGQFAFGNPARVLRLLHDAGYPTARVRPFDFNMRFPADDIARTATGLSNMGQTGRLLRDHPEALRTQAATAIAQAITPLAKGPWIDLPARVLLFEAAAP